MRPLRGSRIALTGATGFLGRVLVPLLQARGTRVVAVVRSLQKSADVLGVGVEAARADLMNPEALTEAFGGAEAVIANAAMTSSDSGDFDEYVRVNVQGAENTLRAAKQARVKRVLYVSTAGVYRLRLGRAMNEDSELLGDRRWSLSYLTTDHRYVRSKARAEAKVWRLAEELGLDLTVIRPAALYGPGDFRLSLYYRQATQRPVCLAPTALFPHVHAQDVAQAMVTSLEAPTSIGRAYNLSGESLAPYQVLRRLRKLTGAGPRLIPLWIPLAIRFDDSAAKGDLGFKARPIEQGLSDLIAPPDQPPA